MPCSLAKEQQKKSAIIHALTHAYFACVRASRVCSNVCMYMCICMCVHACVCFFWALPAGMRANCELVVWVNMGAAMQAGIKFYQAGNKVPAQKHPARGGRREEPRALVILCSGRDQFSACTTACCLPCSATLPFSILHSFSSILLTLFTRSAQPPFVLRSLVPSFSYWFASSFVSLSSRSLAPSIPPARHKTYVSASVIQRSF